MSDHSCPVCSGEGRVEVRVPLAGDLEDVDLEPCSSCGGTGEVTARDEAIEAMADKQDDLYRLGETDERLADRFLHRLLDAIPADVLARYLIERGGLEQIGRGCKSQLGSWDLHSNPSTLHMNDVPVYRVTEAPQ